MDFLLKNMIYENSDLVDFKKKNLYCEKNVSDDLILINCNGKELYIGSNLSCGSCGSINNCIFKGIENIVKIIKKKNGIVNIIEPLIMSSIINENLNNSIDILEDNNFLYIIQEKAISDLYLYRKTNCNFDEKKYEKFIKSIIDALCILHSNNIIHGDIKLNNIFLYPENKVRLADYSYSVFDNSVSQPKGNNNEIYKMQKNICTTTHRPLEAWNTEKWGKEVDIWALGCTIFELIYGYSLFPLQEGKTNIIIEKKYKNAIYDWFINQPINNGKIYKKFNIIYNNPLIPYNINKKTDKIHLILLQCLKNDRLNIFELRDLFFPSGLFCNNFDNIINNCNIKDLSENIISKIKYDCKNEQYYVLASYIISHILLNKKIKLDSYNNLVIDSYLDICKQMNYSLLPILL